MAYRIQLTETNQSFQAEGDETILEAALRAGVNMAHDCRLGGCGTCRVRLTQGMVAYEDQPFALTPEEQSQGFALACQARPRSDLMIASGDDHLQPPQRRAAVVREIHPLCEGVTRLVLEVDGTTPLDYRPGQYMNVYLEDGSTRSFSMASMPDGCIIDFHLRRVPRGLFTDRRLARLKPGDLLDVALPLGSFFYRKQDFRPLLMVATGTGLAPIKCILQSLMDDPDCPPIRLYWGMRNKSDLYMHGEILQWRDRFCEFEYIPVLSRPDAGWCGRRGYVQHAVEEDLDDFSGHAIYLCGSPAMIHDARRSFIAHGASIEHLYADSFSFAHELAAEPAIA